MQSNIKKDYFWNTLGVLLQNAISPLLLIVVTRINGIDGSGLFSFAFSVAIIFWVFAMWGGRTYQVSDISRRFSHRSYIMVRLVLTVITILCAILFSLVNHYDQTKTSIIIVLVLYKAIESIADAVYGVLQVNDRLHVAGKSLIYKATSSFIAFIIIDILTHTILLASLGMVIANIIWLFMYDLQKARRLEPIAIATNQVKREVINALGIMKETWPVFIVIFLSMFSLNIPRYFVDLYHEGQIGYFGILAMPITLIGLVMTFVLQPRIVHLSKLFDQHKYRELQKIISNLLLVTLAIGIFILGIMYVLGIPVLTMVFGVSFGPYKSALMIITVGGILNAVVSVFINIFTIIRQFKGQFYILLVSNIVLVFLSMRLIRTYGLQGSVLLFTTVNAAQMTALFITYKVSLRRLQRRIS